VWDFEVGRLGAVAVRSRRVQNAKPGDKFEQHAATLSGVLH
jgi:hypothetical protein